MLAKPHRDICSHNNFNHNWMLRCVLCSTQCGVGIAFVCRLVKVEHGSLATCGYSQKYDIYFITLVCTINLTFPTLNTFMLTVSTALYYDGLSFYSTFTLFICTHISLTLANQATRPNDYSDQCCDVCGFHISSVPPHNITVLPTCN